MPEVTWHYLEDQIGSITAHNRKLMNAILKDHHDKLVAAAETDARLTPLVEFLEPIYVDWGTKYGAWKNAQAAYRGATQGLDNYLAILREKPPGEGRSKIDLWASKIASIWSVGHPTYQYLLPNGREPFTTGSRDEMIGEVNRLGQRLAVVATQLADSIGQPYTTPEQVAEWTEQRAAMVALHGKVTAFHTQLSGARTLQTQQEGAVDRLSGQVKPARLAAAEALYHNLAALMTIFYKVADRDQVTGFFDLALIINPPEPSDEEPDPEVPETPAP